MAIDIDDFLKTYDEYTKNTQSVDRALFLLLKKYKNVLPVIDENFHKSFRQIDFIDDPYMDIVIWILLNNVKIFHEVVNELNSEYESL